MGCKDEAGEGLAVASPSPASQPDRAGAADYSDVPRRVVPRSYPVR